MYLLETICDLVAILCIPVSEVPKFLNVSGIGELEVHPNLYVAVLFN
jgi:hypothetical protein